MSDSFYAVHVDFVLHAALDALLLSACNFVEVVYVSLTVDSNRRVARVDCWPVAGTWSSSRDILQLVLQFVFVWRERF